MFASPPYRYLYLILWIAAVYDLLPPEALRASELDNISAQLAAVQKIPVPIPEKTLFDNDPKARAIYLEEYCAGYRTVLATVIIDCHMGVKGPYLEAMQQGWADGKNAALKAYPEKAAKLLGIPWDQYKTMIEEPKATTSGSSSK